MTFSGRVTSYLVAGAIAFALVFYVLGQVSALFGAHDAEITAASLARIHAHPALMEYRAKLAAAERRLADSARAEHTVADSLRQQLARAPTHPDTVRILGQIATADSGAYERCSAAFRTCGERATSAENEANDLRTQLAAQVKVHDKRCGLFGGGGVAAGKGSGAGLVLAVGCRLWP